MRVVNTVRVLLLGGLIVTGLILYRDRDAQTQNDPVTLFSLVPSPVSVTELTSPASQAVSNASPARMFGQATSPRG